jgi:hypothetical protein
MSFLAPLFLLGGLAVALPVVFHLVRHSSREKMTFSSLMFLKPTPPRLTRRNRLEHIFLLLLRCLALCILALGFARPFLQRPMSAAPANETGAHVVLLVDTSASMKRENLWADALARAETELRKISPADQAAVLTFDDQFHTVVSFEQWNAMSLLERAALAVQRLKGAAPTWHSTHLGNALTAAADLLEDAEKNQQHTGARRIILITDLQEGARMDGVQGHDWPRQLEVTIVPLKAKRPTNAGLQWVMDADDSASASVDSPVRIRVSNSADATREQFQVRWADIPNVPSMDAYVPPGQSRIMPAPKISEGTNGSRLALSGDDNDFDNTAYIVQPKAEEVNVLYLGGDAETNSAEPLYYLKRAFQDTRRQTVRLSSAESTATAGQLSTNRLLIITSALPGNQTAIREFINSGGTVLFTMSEANSAKTLGELANAPQLTASEAAVGNYAMLGQINFEHPLFAPFADPRFSDFTKLRFWKHRKLSLDGVPNARVIARFDDGDPAIAEIPVERGHILVFAFSWRPADSQFALSSKFVPMLYSILDQAGGVHAQLAQYRVGDSVDLVAIAQKSGGTLSIRKPDGSQVQLAASEPRFTQTDQPGIYEIAAANPPIRFAVNLDPSESRTAPLPLDELERLGIPVKPAETAVTQLALQQKTLRDAELESRQKLWRWLIVGALAVLFGETWLAGRITRRRATTIEAAA